MILFRFDINAVNYTAVNGSIIVCIGSLVIHSWLKSGHML